MLLLVILQNKKKAACIVAVDGSTYVNINPLNAELNTIRHWLALVGTHHIYHVSRVRVNILYHSGIKCTRKTCATDYTVTELSFC